MRLSRRDALRAGAGLLAAAGAAGCVERRVTRRETRVENGASWALNPSVGASLGQEAFDEYVDEMSQRYDDSGVFGADAETPDDLETAYVQRLVVFPEDSGEAGGSRSSLDPEADLVGDASPALIVDAAVAVYGTDDDRYRYWLWAAADGSDDDLARDVDVSSLEARVAFREGSLQDSAQVTGTGDEASVSMGSPPSGSFPLGESTDSLDTRSAREDGGHYGVNWRGEVGGAQSINGVCEEERSGDHDFFWRIAAGYSYAEQL